MFETKIAIIIREDLMMWQKLNVTAFLMSGVVGSAPSLIGQPYEDADGNLYNSLSIQPVIVLSSDLATLSTIHRRALDREVRCALYIEEMFTTGHDEENRSVFKQFGPDTAKVVGLSLRADKKLVDKITKGARMHG
jgi:hypothetical protein